MRCLLRKRWRRFRDSPLQSVVALPFAATAVLGLLLVVLIGPLGFIEIDPAVVVLSSGLVGGVLAVSVCQLPGWFEKLLGGIMFGIVGVFPVELLVCFLAVLAAV